jgi:hypothetical protein
MAEHREVEYATAAGNDLPAHEETYANFVQLAYVGSCLAACILIGLAIGATTGYWMVALPIILFIAPVVAAVDLALGTRMPSGVMVVISLLALALTAGGK